MSTAGLSLVITTPLDVVVEAEGVASLGASDDSGAFGVLPGHADLLAVLRSCVVRWRTDDGPWKYCALHGGVMTVEGGGVVRIACREAIVGTDLASLEAQVAREREVQLQAAQTARVTQARLHARAIRQIMQRLSHGHGIQIESELEEVFQ